MANSSITAEALSLLQNLLSSPVLINSIANSVQTNNASTPANSKEELESEIRTVFRPTPRNMGQRSVCTAANDFSHPAAESNFPCQSLRYQTRQRYCSWAPKGKKRPKTPLHRTFNKDVVLLSTTTENSVVKQNKKRRLYEKGNILSAFEFDKTWDYRTVISKIEAFRGKIPCDVRLEMLMPCGNNLVAPTLCEGQQLDANMIHKVFKRASLYLRPSIDLEPVILESSDSEDSWVEEEMNPSNIQDRQASVSTRPNVTREGSHTFASANAWASTQPAAQSQASASSQSSRAESSADALASSSFQQQASAQPSSSFHPPASSQTANSWQRNYGTYISLINDYSDEEDDDDLYSAIIASIEDQTRAKEDIPIHQILTELGEKIDTKTICKFNINRSAVLDGAIRGFRRLSYNPNSKMSIKFSDDKGTSEEAVDLGGPRREFLRLLIEALTHSGLFEGSEGNLNLALNSHAVREDRYFIAGRAIAVTLVHGGPPPCFLSKTRFTCIAEGPEMSRPALEDIADTELFEKLKKVSESKTLEDLRQSTEPLTDYLANAGCLNNLTSLTEKDQLVEDVLMFQVVNRVRGPFQRFREGLKTLGVLQQIQQHPEAFRSVLCYQPGCLTADIMDGLFDIRWSEKGTNKRADENKVVAYWRDYLQDTEEEERRNKFEEEEGTKMEDDEGTKKLEDILSFATGSNAVPAIGFSPKPSIEFIHPRGSERGRYPVANTCVNCLRLPIHNNYNDFKNNMDFAIRNTQGFGML